MTKVGSGDDERRFTGRTKGGKAQVMELKSFHTQSLQPSGLTRGPHAAGL